MNKNKKLDIYSKAATGSLETKPSMFFYLKRFMKIYGKWILGILIVAFITGLLVYIYWSYQDYHRTKAFESLYLAQGNEDYQQVIEKYKGSVADELAYLEIAKNAYTEGNLHEAKSLLEDFSNRYRNSFFQPYASLTLAAILENEGELDRALIFYQNIVDNIAFEYAWSSAQYRMCSIFLEKERLSEAEAVLEALKERAKGPVWERKLAVLNEALAKKKENQL